MKPLEHELELTTRAVLAAENWAAAYSNAPKQHAELIRLTAKMQLQVMRYLRELAKEAPSLVNWYHYSAAVAEQQHAFLADSIQAYNIDIVINNNAVSQQDQAFIKIVFDTVATVVATGASSMEAEHGAPIGLSSTSSIIQNLTTKQLANLVGMRVQKDGTIIPNPKPEYNIDETTRTRIAQSVKTSIQLGEDHTQAVKRLKSVIADADRADMIAYTETVRAYAEGRKAYGLQSGASYKVWSDNNAVDVCADNTAQGPIAIGDTFVSGDDNEPAHPHCLVGGTLVSSSTIGKTMKRFYRGDIVTIRTTRGNELTVTPNHPILTSQGWMAAGELKEGINLLSSVDPQGVTSAIDPNDYNIPTLIEDVVESFGRLASVFTKSVKGTPIDFHGDGINGEVTVVKTNSFLGDRINGKTISEPLRKQKLSWTRMKSLNFDSLSTFQFGLKRFSTTALSVMSRLRQPLALFGTSTTHTNVTSFAHSPQHNFMLTKNTIDGHTTGTEPLSELFDGLTSRIASDKVIDVFKDNLLRVGQPSRPTRSYKNPTINKNISAVAVVGIQLFSKLTKRFSGNVASDKVISIKRSSFSGHVYNLETATGWYIANGIITHNCKCLTTYLYADSVEEAKSQWES